MSQPHLLFVVGPTATGKTDFALQAAANFQAEIINCDSVQFYQGVEIGTAKPTAGQLQMVPHHLVNFVPEGGSFTAGDYTRAAEAVISSRFAMGVRNFLVVGGSGFYVQALEKGMFEVPEIPAEIRAQVAVDLKEKNLADLYQEVLRRDPLYAARIKTQDRYRIGRALELMRSRQRSMSEIQAEFKAKVRTASYAIHKIGLTRPRAVLRELVSLRTEQMLSRGWIDEVKALRAKGLGEWLPMRSVGYREIQDYLDGKLTEAELRERIIISTMQLAKRQMTWFKRDLDIQWFDSGNGFAGALQTAAACIKGK